MKQDDLKFIMSVIITLCLLAFVLFSSYRNEKLSAFQGSGTKVDLKRVERLVSEGQLTLHPAEFSKVLKKEELEQELMK